MFISHHLGRWWHDNLVKSLFTVQLGAESRASGWTWSWTLQYFIEHFSRTSESDVVFTMTALPCFLCKNTAQLCDFICHHSAIRPCTCYLQIVTQTAYTCLSTRCWSSPPNNRPVYSNQHHKSNTAQQLVNSFLATSHLLSLLLYLSAHTHTHTQHWRWQ